MTPRANLIQKAAVLFSAAVLQCFVMPAAAASQAGRTGLEVGGLPAINFDSDEGFGYGAIAELYQYGDGTSAPYSWTLQPTVFLTTEGRRDFTVFFDAPNVIPGGWRLDVFAGSERQIATPYYGTGNTSVFDEALEAEEGPNPSFYRYGRLRRSLTANLQRGLGDTSLRLLVGVGLVRHSLTPVPDGSATTLFASDVGTQGTSNWANFGRAGLIWDTRDRETGPGRGSWSEVIVQRVPGALGADRSYNRLTLTDRRYFTLAPGLVFAHRYLVQQVSEGAPVHELFQVQTSFKQQEGLGGAKTVRGLPKNRYVGRGMLIWNAELRWRATDFQAVGRSFHVVLSGFVDQGRVWQDGVDVSELLSELHRGYGGGVRLGMGENFTVAIDLATSDETGLPMYIGLGYLY
ncbi:MAG: Omp85 family outer membrane protein [Longimicrobiales bacterium]